MHLGEKSLFLNLLHFSVEFKVEGDNGRKHMSKYNRAMCFAFELLRRSPPSSSPNIKKKRKKNPMQLQSGWVEIVQLQLSCRPKHCHLSVDAFHRHVGSRKNPVISRLAFFVTCVGQPDTVWVLMTVVLKAADM